MKLLYVEKARSMWMFDLRLLNPRGLDFQGVFERLDEKYRFAKAPRNVLDLNEQKILAFQYGSFLNSGKIEVTVSLEIYNNGIAAETSSNTSDSTEFLKEVANWITTEYGFVIPPEKSLGKGYMSQVGVELDGSLSASNSKFSAISQLLSSRVKTLDGKPRQFEIASLGFWTEDIGKVEAPAAFRLERKWGTPFSSTHYFSQAPLETQAHIDILAELEAALRPDS